MFTGIVEELGVVRSFARRGAVYELAVECGAVMDGTAVGDSIAVNGVCLTVVSVKKPVLVFEVMAETAGATTTGALRISEKVNLERSLQVGDRISGHFVTGHIDCVGIIRSKRTTRGNLVFEIAVKPGSAGYIVPKGSIAVDGISLTISSYRSGAVSVCIIPHTLKNTTLAFKGPSDKVNIEFDILAKKS